MRRLRGIPVRGLWALLATLMLSVAAAVGCSSDDGAAEPASSATEAVSASEAPSATRTPAPAVTASATAPAAPVTATPGPPYRVDFASGDVIDVSPAVVFGDLETGAAEAWVVPDANGEFAVSPSGTFVIYQDRGRGGAFRLLRTDTGVVVNLEIGGWPIEFGPGDSGFIAVDEQGFVVQAYDANGQSPRSLWLSAAGNAAVAAWAEDGSIAVGQNLTGELMAVSAYAAPALTPVPPGEEFRTDDVRGDQLSLEWSPDSELLAVVTRDAVRVLGRDNQLVWEVEGEFFGNPQWAPDGAYLTVNAMPRVVGHDGTSGVTTVTYLLSRGGDEVLRVTGAGGCSESPWVGASSFVAGRYLVLVDGRIRRYTGELPEVWLNPEELGFGLAAGLDTHRPHIAWRGPGQLLEDGRLVFTTPGTGHGGCGTLVGASEWPQIAVERPPYGEVRSGVVVALEALASQPGVARVVDALFGVPADRQVDRLLELTHRDDAPCSFHGELSSHCEAVGLDVHDSFPGIRFAATSCEGCHVPVDLAQATLTDVAGNIPLNLDAIWRVPPSPLWPYPDEGADDRFAVWLLRSDWRAQRGEEWIGVLLIVSPSAERPIVVVEPSQVGWTGYDTAALFGNWDVVYLARPIDPLP